MPPLNPLRAFEAAARHLSMSRAAAELNVTHGAISHQVRALEESLKVRLFTRIGGTLQLTAQGAALLPSVTHAFGSIAEAVTLLAAPEQEGRLSVCCLPSLMTFWLLPRLNRFSQVHPGIGLTLTASNDPRRVRDDDIDIWITYGVGNWADRISELWYEPTLIPVASPALVNSKPLRSIDDLRSHTLLHADDGTEWNLWLETAGVPELACGSRHVMSDGHLAIEAAFHGHGIALGDSLTSIELLSSGRVVKPLAETIRAPRSFYLVWRKEMRRSPLVSAFRTWAFAEIGGRPT